ncbi:uncharacterized protein N7503_009300 [Penicillium pulvis]|uniref:uncharacterized protein n=1 Tax=Penicillium pulvis TaxID=1562058 RepID=UPI0025468164|nr:uncharacterized protein N7503_009300 [Penicillium pulvis]KAJ5793322.1 hypothetical protein N7503_009300 [Penicillium pulvis]
MFGNRPNAQKPKEGLINQFQAAFADVVRPTIKQNSLAGPAINPDQNHVQITPSLRFTPFLDDHCLPTPKTPAYNNNIFDDLNKLYHGPAGDLHTPTVGSNLLTPKTLLEQFAVTPLPRNPAGIAYDSLDPLFFARESQSMDWGNPSAAYPPSAFVHSDLADGFLDEPSEQFLPSDMGNQEPLVSQLNVPQESETNVDNSPSEGQNDFRYQVTLNTPTAMIHDPNDTPVTYLNKGHQYTLSVSDSTPPLVNGLVHYRTSVRVSFEEPEHVANPAACWSLWTGARGHEGNQENGNKHAVEMVDLVQGNKDPSYPVHLERTSLDGFCVTWCANPSTGRSGCTIGIRFNFLSTDFSHSKGVKGAPLRLCAKTETALPGTAESSFCYVKLFRDHGAERKMFNDVSQLKRAIEKRKQDFLKAESGDSLGKRKRGSRSVYSNDQIPEKERKAELRSRMDAELASMQQIFYSNRPVTTLCLRGEHKDDPDLFPVFLEDQTHLTTKSQPHLQIVTPPSTLTGASSHTSQSSVDPQLPGPQRDAENIEWIGRSGPSGQYSSSVGSEDPSDSITTTHTSPAVPMISTEDAELMDVDSKSNAPAKCLYLRFHQNGVQKDDYHTAVYLTEPTANELVDKISQKQNFNRDHRVHLFHLKPNGMKIMIDDDVVERIPNGQDMTAEVSELEGSNDTDTNRDSVPTIDVRLSF